MASSSPPASSDGNGDSKAFKGAASSPPAPLGSIPEGDEYSAMTDEEARAESIFIVLEVFNTP